VPFTVTSTVAFTALEVSCRTCPAWAHLGAVVYRRAHLVRLVFRINVRMRDRMRAASKVTLTSKPPLEAARRETTWRTAAARPPLDRTDRARALQAAKEEAATAATAAAAARTRYQSLRVTMKGRNCRALAGSAPV
jgi:hypothetical protein